MTCDEIFVNIKMNDIKSLHDKSIIETMIKKYKKGEVIFPARFRLVGLETNGERLVLDISPLESFSLIDMYEDKPTPLSQKHK